MNAQRIAVALSAANLLLLALLLTRELPSAAIAETSSAPMLRGRALELVDDRGQVRARLDAEPDGEVVFRLVDRQGRIRVKLGASESGSGLLLLDEETEPGVQVIARRAGTAATPKTTAVTLTGPGGRQRVIAP